MKDLYVIRGQTISLHVTAPTCVSIIGSYVMFQDFSVITQILHMSLSPYIHTEPHSVMSENK